MDVLTQQSRSLIEQALSEDLGFGDITAQAIVGPDVKGTAKIVCKDEAVLSGQEVAAYVFSLLSHEIKYQVFKEEGAVLKKGDVIATIEGSFRDLLAGERLALNFLQRLSGVATTTRRFVSAVNPLKVNIMDTRKTTPLWRELEKRAVVSGGGVAHRWGLYDQILIKENHLYALMVDHAYAVEDAIADAIYLAKEAGHHPVEIEVQNREQAILAAQAGAHIILLDNMTVTDLVLTVRSIAGLRLDGSRPLLEASGGVNLLTVRSIAETGVDRISVGALTHSYESTDFSMLVDVHD